jgi:two-component system chemotaxis sensor kinase CheA
MDDLVFEFLAETNESLSVLDVELVRFEQNPNDREILSNVFRLMHTIKGTCGFLGLERLERVAHAGEDVLGKFRDGELNVTPAAVGLILRCIDQIRELTGAIEEAGAEPEGDDAALIGELRSMADGDTPTAPEAAHQGSISMSDDAAAADISESETGSPVLSNAGFPMAADMLAEIEAWEASGIKAASDSQIAADLTAEAEKEKSSAQTPDPVMTPEPAPKHDGDAKGHKDAHAAQPSIRVNVQVLENLMTLVSEMVLTRNNLLQMVRGNEDSEFAAPLQRLSLITTDLQEGVMKTRMQPIGNAWSKLPRIVRDLAVELGKKIELRMFGEETELDRQVLELIKDPLTHMVRNSADHGLETPEMRAAAGKPETGTITLRAYHEGGHIIIEIADDGRGLNMDRIRRKCLENGLATEEELAALTDSQIQQFILKPGFSTAEKVTSVSGRGVGMDVVRTNIEQIGGTIQFKSVENRGSTFIIKIPLTLAIVSALIVRCGGERFAIPQLSVKELVRLSPQSGNRVESLNGAPVLRLRDRLLPLVSLGDILHLDPSAENALGEFFVIVTQIGTHQFGLLVDQVFDTEEIVVKPVARVLRDISFYSGNTILGDGSVIMILDLNGIAAATGQTTMSSDEPVESKQRNREQISAFLIFRSGDDSRKAVPMALVARLEEIDMTTVEHVAGRRVVQYRERLMPLVSFDSDRVWRTDGRQPVLVFSDRERSMGLAVDDIVDIVEDEMDIELVHGRDGVIGSSIIDGKATDVVDVRFYLTQAFTDWFDSDGSEESVLSPQKRLLLVDDSSFFRNLFAPYLSAAGFEVVTANSAKVACDIIEDGETFSAIVSDIEMDDVDGFEFASWVREKSRLADVPLIALSSHSSKEAVERGLGAGFNRFVCKAQGDQLLGALQELI